MTQGAFDENVTLSTMCIASAQWQKHPASANPTTTDALDRRDSGISDCSTLSMEAYNSGIPSASKHYKHGSFYTASILVPITLPQNKNFIPTFHTCLVSRIYSLSIHVSANAPGVSDPSLHLKVPLQICAEGSATGNENARARSAETIAQIHLVRGVAPPAASSAPTAASPLASSTPSSGPAGGLGGLFPGIGAPGSGRPSGLFGAGFPELEQVEQHLSQNPNLMREIMNMPAMQNLMNNPDLIRNMIMSNPQMREIMDRNPDLAHVLNDPSVLRQTLEAARNPEIMREMMRNTDRAMSNIESSPEGFNMLRRMYETVQEPFLNATTMGGEGNTASNPFSALLGNQGSNQPGQGQPPTNAPTTGSESTTGTPAPNTNPLPNPWNTNAGGAQGATRSSPSGNARTGASGGIGSTGATGGLGGLGSPDLSSLLGGLAGSPRTGAAGGLGGLGSPDLGSMLGGSPDASLLSQMLQNPAMMQMMQSIMSDPQTMNQLLNFNPSSRNLMESNTQMREMLQNPEFLRQLTSPETLQQLLLFQQSLLGQLGQHQPNQDGNNAGIATGTRGNPSLDTLMGMLSGLGSGGGLGVPNTSNVPPEERYATQLTQLQEMGFIDTAENIQALVATAGNVHAAVERLLGNLGQ